MSHPLDHLTERVRRCRLELAALAEQGGQGLELGEQEAELVLTLAEHLKREEERRVEEERGLLRVKVGAVSEIL